MECFKCEISGDKVLLFDAITSKGIVKICAKCSKEENIPLINKPAVSRFDEYKHRTKDYPREQTKKSVVYERLSNISGVRVQDGRKDPAKSADLLKEEKNLKRIADKNFEARISGSLKPTEPKHAKKLYHDLVDNFHWVIMRARRSNKLTAEHLAREIAEPESAIKMAEQGILPGDYRKLISKIESILEIKLVKKEFREKREKLLEKSFPEKIDLKSNETKTLTIADLKEMKRARESEIFKKPQKEEGFKEEIVFNKKAKDNEPEFVMKESKENVKGEEELTDNEIDDIIFGRR